MAATVSEIMVDLAGDVGGKRLVDLGAGREGLLARLETGATPLLALAVDLDLAALTDRRDGSTRVVADLAGRLPLRTGSVDLVASHNTLECLPDTDAFLGECRRVLTSDGRLLLAHTEFESITVNANDRELCRRMVRAYADLPVPYRFMRHADPQMGRQLPGLVRRSGFAVATLLPQVTVLTSLTGRARDRITEMSTSVRRACERGLTDLTRDDVETWLADLAERDAAGEFFFSETAYIVEARPSASSSI